ncbi:MAG: single-stranded-DNA-specific exonuclease RecJ [Nitrospirae bacterium]|nr:single-stranded-DNA-specific exonuclease RecJ [Nitrospirota bacterium]
MTKSETAHTFLNPRLEDLPHPTLLNGMREAAERAARAIHKGERIGILGDYDVDGISSAALCVWFFRAINEPIETYIPDRERDGYGMNRTAVDALHARGVGLLLTADCGTTNIEEIRHARSLGMDVVVLDHHEVGAEAPPAFALLNPKKPDSGYPDQGLCSTALTFLFLSALRQCLKEDGRFGSSAPPNLRQHLDLVALATVADVVPLRGANRILVHHGLSVMAGTSKPGLRALMGKARVDPANLRAHALAFYLAPRINAAGRLGDAGRALRLLTALDPEEADSLAGELDRENQRRQAIEEDHIAGAMAQVAEDSAGLVLASEDWHPGVIGIVAARVVERFHRPAVLIAVRDGVGKASVRSVPGLDIVRVLAACGSHLVKFGGHKQAAGLTVASTQIPAFRSAFDAEVRAALEHVEPGPFWLDERLPLEEISGEKVDEIERLEPFGEGNPRPVFFAPDVEIRLSRTLRSRMLLLSLRRGARTMEGTMRAIEEAPPEFPRRADVAFTLEKRVWRGESTLGLRVRQWRAYEAEA